MRQDNGNGNGASVSNATVAIFEASAPAALGEVKIGGKTYDVKAPRVKNFAAYLSAAKLLESEGESERFRGIVDVLMAGVPGLAREVIEELELDDGIALVTFVTDLINKRIEAKEKANLANPSSGTSSPSAASGASPLQTSAASNSAT